MTIFILLVLGIALSIWAIAILFEWPKLWPQHRWKYEGSTLVGSWYSCSSCDINKARLLGGMAYAHPGETWLDSPSEGHRR